MRPTFPLYRFHLITGSRLALRAWTPLIGAATIGIGLQPDPAATLAGIAGALAGHGRSWTAWLLVGIVLAAGAVWAAPRVTLGARGWIDHLPASRRARFLALWAALAASLLPPAVLLLALAALQAASRRGVVWWAFPAVPLLALAASGAVLALSRPGKRPGAWVAGERSSSGRAPVTARLPFDLRVARRALGPRILSAWVVAASPLLAAWLFARNNTLPAALERRGVVLGAALAFALGAGLLAEELAARRPVWPWARALPVGSRRRVRADALVLGVLLLPLAVIAAAIDPFAALITISGLPLLALRASAALRGPVEGRTAALAPVLAEGATIAAALTLFPVCALLALLAVPLAVRAAARADRALRVTRWSERHHQATGDSLSWTA